MNACIALNPQDNVAVALQPLKAGEQVCDSGIALRTNIASGHKFALRNIRAGEAIIKYGHCIAQAKNDIQQGEHVHTHNAVMPSEGSSASIDNTPGAVTSTEQFRELLFQGYQRSDGRVGTRNFIGIITTVNCAATVARQIENEVVRNLLPEYSNIDGVVSLRHTSGCSAAVGAGYKILQRTLAGFARHPNFGGVLLVGLGCEDNAVERLIEDERLLHQRLLRSISIQASGGTVRAIKAGVSAIQDMLPAVAGQRRKSLPISNLRVALQCGGSDAYSGISANPALGCAVDRLVEHGATAVLSETPEIFGAESLLLARAKNAKVRQKMLDLLEWWVQSSAKFGICVSENPSKGNKEGGITTIVEKSLGAVAKAGKTTLNGVYQYAEEIEERGLCFMDSPGNDFVSVTGQVAAGCNVICFSTGRGSVFGCKPAPSIKLSTNSELFARMSEDIDLNCGDIVGGYASVEEVGQKIFEKIVAVSSGEPTKSEMLGFGDEEFAPWQFGPVL